MNDMVSKPMTFEGLKKLVETNRRECNLQPGLLGIQNVPGINSDNPHSYNGTSANFVRRVEDNSLASKNFSLEIIDNSEDHKDLTILPVS